MEQTEKNKRAKKVVSFITTNILVFMFGGSIGYMASDVVYAARYKRLQDQVERTIKSVDSLESTIQPEESLHIDNNQIRGCHE